MRKRLWRWMCAGLCAAMWALPLGGARAAGPAVTPAQAAGLVPVIVYLQAQPFIEEAAARQDEFQAQTAAVAGRIAAAGVPSLPSVTPGGPALTDAQEAAALAAAPALSAAGEARQEQALAELDTLLAAQRAAVYQAATAQVAASQAPVEKLIVSLGGVVTARIEVVNALGARVPASALAALAQHPAVAAVTPDTVAEGALDTSPLSINADAFWDGGYTGGVLDVAVIDTGVDDTHPAFAEHGFIEQRFLAMAGGLAGADPSADDINGHGTHVAGIVGSRVEGMRGVAFGFDTLLNAKAGYDTDGSNGGPSSMYTSDSMDAAEWAIFQAAQPAEVVNLSFASCASSDDSHWARFWDAVVGASGVSVAVAGGNNGPCPRVTDPSIAYNVISVANVDDLGDTNRANDTLSATSSLGPTLGGRRKPDLAAPGTNINSANAVWEFGNPDFKLMTGTSMAAPHVAGAAVLLMQAGVTDPRAVKAVLINTAEDKGTPGWDPGYGWGYIDLEQAYIHRGDNFLSHVSNAQPYRLFKGPAVLSDTATLVWNRHLAYPCANRAACGGPLTPTVPLSNLNLALYGAATNSLLHSSNTLTDTVEQVTAPGASALNVVKVSLASLATGLSQEDFALATEEGFTPAVGPVLADGSNNHVVPVGTPRVVDIRLVNSGDLPAHGVVLTVTTPSGLNLPQGTLTYTVPFLDAGGVYTVTHTATLLQDEARAFAVSASGIGYGLTFTLSDTLSVVPLHFEWWLPAVTR